MPNLDDLLTPDVAHEAADSARVPAFGALAACGARRRRARRTTVLVGSVAVVATIAVGADQLTLPSATSPSPAPQPTGTRSPGTPSTPKPSSGSVGAKRVLGAPDARIQSLTLAPGASDHRLGQWYTCLDPGSCQSRSYAIAVTGDGFASRRVVDLPVARNAGYSVEPAGPDHFIVSGGNHLRVVGLDGRSHPVRIGGATAPVARGEVISTAVTRRPVVVDPATALAHPLSLPRGDTYVQGQPGRLWAYGARNGYATSEDGGAHWTPVAVPASAAAGSLSLIPSSDPSVFGFIVGGTQINSTLTWLGTVRGTVGAAFTSYPPAASTIDPGASTILPDGRLLVLVTTWRSWATGRHSPRAGFYASRDWAHLTEVHMGAPFAHLDYTSVPTILGVTADPGTLTVYAATPDETGIVASTDGGATWHDVAAR